MKSNLFLLALCTLLLTACKFDSVNFGDGRKIHPSSQIVKNEYRQPAFDKLDIDVVANVKFIQSDSNDYRVVLSCPDNYVELFKFETEGSELNVKFSRDNVNIEGEHVDVTVYSPRLRSLDNSGVASVEVSRLTTDKLEVENSGVGTLYLSGLTVNQLEAECSGVGNIELSGQTGRAELECSGVGSIKAENLKAQAVKAEVSGVGGIRCHATERIDGEVSGVGSLKYGGKPQQKQLRRSGLGEIAEL
ncbi:MAG: DUF2807 domain-containing protein [Prevotella sp.]|nr:DUF2807 domain-containing protein [Prevotella sp.]